MSSHFENTNNSNNCSICLNDLDEGLTTNLPCNHTFHQACFQLWANYNNSCPYCRYQIVQNMIPQVLYDELIAQDGYIERLNETNYRQFYKLNENTFPNYIVTQYINSIRAAKILKDSLQIFENYRITANYNNINNNIVGRLIKITQITYAGTFACHFIVNGINMVFFNNLYNFELVN